MAWCSTYLPQLAAGNPVRMRPRGQSMKGIINSGALVEVAPIQDGYTLGKGDVVLCKVKSNYYLHLIKSVRGQGELASFLIGNARGGTNGWTPRKNIFGIYTKTLS